MPMIKDKKTGKSRLRKYSELTKKMKEKYPTETSYNKKYAYKKKKK